MTKYPSSLLALACGCALLASSAAFAEQSAQQEQSQKMAELPTCAKSLGTITVLEPEHDYWSQYQLSSPTALIKVFVAKSHCFILVDRGRGLAAMESERALSSSGELRNRSNLGKGQMKAADYALTPDLVSRNSDAGGSNVGGAIAGFLVASSVKLLARFI